MLNPKLNWYFTRRGYLKIGFFDDYSLTEVDIDSKPVSTPTKSMLAVILHP